MLTDINELDQITALDSIIRDYRRLLTKLNPVQDKARRAEVGQQINNAQSLLNDLCDMYGVYREQHN